MPNSGESTSDGFDPQRRLILQGFGLAGVAGTALLTGAMQAAYAADAATWPAKAFAQKSEADALKAFYGEDVTMSDKVSLNVPEIAANGAVVPVSVDGSALPNVTSIAVLIPKNPFTLTAAYEIPAGTIPSVSCRVKMAKTANVIAVVKSGGKLYGASKQVKVTLGGCGG